MFPNGELCTIPAVCLMKGPLTQVTRSLAASKLHVCFSATREPLVTIFGDVNTHLRTCIIDLRNSTEFGG